MRCVPSTYVLTNDEKLIARRALRLWRASWRNPQPDEEEWLKAGLVRESDRGRVRRNVLVGLHAQDWRPIRAR